MCACFQYFWIIFSGENLANDSENQMTNSADDEQVGPSVDIFKNSQNDGGIMANKCNKSADYNGRNDEIDDYNDDSNMSDISDLSDVFKLNADILPDMQRSIDWVCFYFLLHYQIVLNISTDIDAIFLTPICSQLFRYTCKSLPA